MSLPFRIPYFWLALVATFQMYMTDLFPESSSRGSQGAELAEGITQRGGLWAVNPLTNPENF